MVYLRWGPTRHAPEPRLLKPLPPPCLPLLPIMDRVWKGGGLSEDCLPASPACGSLLPIFRDSSPAPLDPEQGWKDQGALPDCLQASPAREVLRTPPSGISRIPSPAGTLGILGGCSGGAVVGRGCLSASFSVLQPPGSLSHLPLSSAAAALFLRGLPLVGKEGREGQRGLQLAMGA